MARLFVLDAMNLTYRAYHALLTRQDKTEAELAAERAARPDREPDPSKWAPLMTTRGEASNAILGFANTVLKIRREEEPDYWALAWDGPGPTFRHQRYAEYKATRKPMPADLLSQIEPVERMAQALGLPVIEIPGVEADDVMATLARRAEHDGFDVVLVTGDKDLVQLVNERVKVLAPLRRGDDYAWIDRSAVIQKWGVPPERVPDVLALLGDTIDNVPGVPGIGEKTADELMRAFGSLEGIYEHLDQVKKPSVRAKLEAHREQAFLSRELVTVRADCELPVTWEDLTVRPIRRDALREITTRYELAGLEKRATSLAVADDQAGEPAPGRDARRLGTYARGGGPAETMGRGAARAEKESPAVAAVVDLETRLHETAAAEDATARPEGETAGIVAAGRVALDEPPRRGSAAAPHGITLDLFDVAAAPADLETLEAAVHEVRSRAIHGLALVPVAEGADPRRATLIGLAIASRDGSAAYLPVAHAGGPNFPMDQVRAWLAPALADASVRKLGVDLKRDAHVLEGAGMPLRGLSFDARVVSFLCDAERAHDLPSLGRDALGVALPPLAAPAPRGRAAPGPAAWPVEQAAPAAMAWAAALPRLNDALRAQLESRDQWALYETLERPLLRVLFEMESAGVAVDRARLGEMAARAGEEIARLEAELYSLAGGPLNLNSGPQLAQTLFERLGLKAGRRTKTGYSTDQAVLEELARSHPFPARLLEYRTLAKLKSTYLDALPLAIDPRDGRVHTSFDQAGAATGRISSSDPNLQNIPMRTAQGREIRKAFRAEEGYLLLAADYSQIELRVMAHLSGDEALRRAFAGGEDIHASTARRVFGVSGDLDPALRARAKVVNFGIMYGMGPRSLSSQMGLSLAEAQEFIRRYFQAFAGVRRFLDRTLEEGRRQGYVQTLLGRRRYLPGLSSAHGGERSLAERAAINAPIQGSAADLVKLAMIRVHRALKADHPTARLLLQVHDELLFEADAADAEAVASRVRTEMESAFPLEVPLVVSVGQGRSWFDVH